MKLGGPLSFLALGRCRVPLSGVRPRREARAIHGWRACLAPIGCAPACEFGNRRSTRGPSSRGEVVVIHAAHGIQGFSFPWFVVLSLACLRRLRGRRNVTTSPLLNVS